MLLEKEKEKEKEKERELGRSLSRQRAVLAFACLPAPHLGEINNHGVLSRWRCLPGIHASAALVSIPQSPLSF